MAKSIIILSGGGTMGSVMPLVALWERLEDRFDCIWLGSRKGIERRYVEGLGMPYRAIPAGKIRRYLSLKTLLAPVFIVGGLFASFYYLAVFRPKAVVASGSFVSVPLVWAAWALGVKRVVLQEDLEIGLAGRATVPFASAVAAAFPETLKEIKNKNKFFTGNPVRKMFDSPNSAKWKGDKPSGKTQNLRPLVLVLGGGLGSEEINNAIAGIAPEICKKARILHLTGKNKNIGAPHLENYEQKEGLWGADFAGAMAAADIVVSRAGLSTLSEAAYLGKPLILLPLASVGQDKNADYFAERGAAIVSDVKNLEKEILDLLADGERRKELFKNIKNIFPQDAAEKMAEIIK